MLGFLDTKVTLRHLLILGVIVAVPSMGAGALAAGVSLNGQFSAGSVRMSSASSHTSVAVNGLDAPKRILQTSFTVPAGKTADLQATFSRLLTHQTDVSGYRRLLGLRSRWTMPRPTPSSSPASVQLLGGSSADRTRLRRQSRCPVIDSASDPARIPSTSTSSVRTRDASSRTVPSTCSSTSTELDRSSFPVGRLADGAGRPTGRLAQKMAGSLPSGW